MKVAVLGSGAGALAVAADMSRHGRHTVMASLDGERAGLEPISATGAITVTSAGYIVHRDCRTGPDKVYW